ncbi:heavy metal response regulator transcription factor [Variovorax sp. H27-G14]|uniref:heavy metal response regulator transcription factor n=1 Tax=Variovorax sp. H27-G14 TaxID=3111914 RepID=UPI0038FCEC0B
MKILIVEDELRTADYLSKGLTEQGCTVDMAHNGIDGQHLALTHDYDVIVLDVMLPGQDGFSVLRELRAVKQTPVIMLTARDRVEDRIKGLHEGADDYLIKPFSFLELLARLQALNRRGRKQEPMQLRIADLQIDLLARKAFRNSVGSSVGSSGGAPTRIDLTAKEFALLAVLARRQGEILSKTAIAELVWDMNFDSNTNVVEVAIKRLRDKIDVPFGTKLLHTIRGMGYVMEVRDSGGERGGERGGEGQGAGQATHGQGTGL